MDVCFDDISGFVDHHCLNFLFIIPSLFVIVSLLNNLDINKGGNLTFGLNQMV